MPNRPSFKPITDRFSYCTTCGMLLENCLCTCSQKINSPVEFWLLTTEKEMLRPSNTGRLLGVVMPDVVRTFIWQRGVEPSALMQLINQDNYDVFLLFPNKVESIYVTERSKDSGLKKRAYMLIDATWKEAKRILRLSPYLKGITKVSFGEGLQSEYSFRRGGEDGQLCTYEAAIELLKAIGEDQLAKVGEKNFKLYLKAFKATIHGHPMKD